MRWKGLLFISLVILTGCRNVLASQAVRNAEIAIGEQLYEQANSFLHLASVESSSNEYEALHQQSIYLMKMEQYKLENDLDNLLLNWTELNLISSDSNIVREESIQLLRRMLSAVEVDAKIAIDEGGSGELITFIRLIEERMGTFVTFESEIETLIELREQLEGVRSQ